MSSPVGEGNSFGALLDQVMFGPGSASLGSANIMDPALVDSAKTARQRADEAVVEAQKKAMEACARAQDAANKATLAGGSGFVFNAEQINTVIDELEQTILPALAEAQRKAQDIARYLAPPGDEKVSIEYVGHVRSSIKSYTDYLSDEIKNVGMKLEAFKFARDEYLKRDRSAEQSLKKV